MKAFLVLLLVLAVLVLVSRVGRGRKGVDLGRVEEGRRGSTSGLHPREGRGSL